MGNLTNIEWTARQNADGSVTPGSTWNPWHGCKKVSAGCKNCYMYSDKARYGQDPTVVLRSKTTFNQPLKHKKGRLIFTCSWSDFFTAEADNWRDEAWDIIRRTPQHTYQILTKRPERIAAHLPADWGAGYANVWLGVSVEHQAAADERIPLLLNVPATIRFLSCEPLLGPVDLVQAFPAFGVSKIRIMDNHGQLLADGSDLADIQWVIIGGESGKDARDCEVAWIRDLVGVCADADVACFVKQLGRRCMTYGDGEWPAGSSLHVGRTMEALRWAQFSDSKGGDMSEWPLDVRVRQIPLIGESFL